MIEFYNIHPEYKSLPFFITGESYAGKYIPIFAKTIIDYNIEQSAVGGYQIPLKALVIGDPLTAPPLQRVMMPTIGKALNIYDDNQVK